MGVEPLVAARNVDVVRTALCIHLFQGRNHLFRNELGTVAGQMIIVERKRLALWGRHTTLLNEAVAEYFVREDTFEVGVFAYGIKYRPERGPFEPIYQNA